MQNGIYKEGWLEFSNHFSMNLTKVLLVTFIFLPALSFAAAAEVAEREKTIETAKAKSLETKKAKLQAVKDAEEGNFEAAERNLDAAKGNFEKVKEILAANNLPVSARKKLVAARKIKG